MTPYEAAMAMSDGAILVDMRSSRERRADGDIPGAITIDTVIGDAVKPGVQWILVSDIGRMSALTAASLRAIGLTNVADVEGGFQRWREAGLPVIRQSRPHVSAATAV